MIKIFRHLAFALGLIHLMAPEARRDSGIQVGGQAVIEGVLMKGVNAWGLAVRRPNKEIFQESWPNSSRTKRMPWKLPIVRGVVIMCEMMATGFKALSRSAEIALEEEQENMTWKDLLLTVLIAIAAVGGLFIALPLWVADFAAKTFALPMVGQSVIEGVARALVFVGYVIIIGMWPDIQQVFRYHGAEHKTINAYESGLTGENLTPDKVMTFSRIHPRCGTSFLLIAVLVSILVFSCISALGVTGFWWRVGSRILLIPVVIGISYEFIRFASTSGLLGRILITPFLCLQYITTREPNHDQAEVGIASLNVALKASDPCPAAE